MTRRTILCIIACLLARTIPVSADEPSTRPEQGLQLRVTVYDADAKLPIELARVALRREGRFIIQDATNPAGQVRFRDIRPGTYNITAWFVGYKTFSDSILVDQAHTIDSIAMQPTGKQQQEVEVIGQREIPLSHIDPSTGNQVFETATYHAPPTGRMTNLIQENLIGAVRAPTGEVHVGGYHAEFTYYVDGIPVPLGVFGGLNEVVDPKAIERATFITGGFPAEYGGQMAAVIDLNNRVPTGRFQLDASTYVGSYLVFNGSKPFSPGTETPLGVSSSAVGDTLGGRVGPFRALNSNGQSLSISDHIGNLGFLVSGSRQETDRRIDPPVPSLFHDHGYDYFLYGKFDYVLSDIDYITSNLNFGKTNTQVPYDPNEQIAEDQQVTTNSFQTLSYYRVLNSDVDQESNFFAGAYAREGELVHTPGDIDPPYFQFAGDTLNSYLLSEDRSFTTIGMRSTLDKRISHELMVKAGLNFSSTSGTENFTSRDSAGNPGPSIVTNFKGSDFGAFAQINWHPAEWTSFDLGVRHDQHGAPDVALQHQVSPRARWNFIFDESNSAYLYYGRLFMPTNVEGLRSIAANVSTTLEPTLPERDDFYEVAYTRSFPFGLRSKLDVTYRKATPGLDDQTIGSSAIKTPVNIETVRITAVGLGLTYSSEATPFSAYMNAAIIHAYGSGAVSGGFLDVSDDGPATDLDHDQRLSIVTGLNYQPEDWFVNLVGIYGSGLTNGNPLGVDYKTGLFDFNTATHTSPSWILNLSGGYTFHLAGGTSLEPSLFITNLLDYDHLIKGAYFSAASWEERRNVIFKLSVHV